MFTIDELVFTYPDENVPVLNGISLHISPGSVVALIGPNASGKSTLARHLNALLLPSSGRVLIEGMDSRDPQYTNLIRQRVGLIFQNPDDQMIGSNVEEEVAFGLGNIGVAPEEIRKRSDEALRMAGIYDLRTQSAHTLSGGEKQRVVLAEVLALRPQGIVLDEATAMLDPVIRQEWLQVLLSAGRKYNLTIFMITHHMDEALLADRVLVLDKGRIVLDGSAAEIFSKVDKLREYGLEPPPLQALMYTLAEAGCPVPAEVYGVKNCAEIISRMLAGE
ncbi:MAG: ATP-binding cassette domain-containing protein [Syntrophomonadaceae bacterium]|nr:ATP-binding cassette domain-containing protein [Syntrophomonadaceae bacterium]